MRRCALHDGQAHGYVNIPASLWLAFRINSHAVFLRLVLIFTFSLLVFAPITGYIAYNYGRSFWRWFAFGLVVPFFSVFVALFMAMRTRAVEDEAADQQLPKPPAAA